MKTINSIFARSTSPENLFAAWEEFRKGKQSRADVMEFESRVEEHLFALHRDIAAGTYRHGPYHAFRICDPKQRQIHKATVRDRIVHHAVFAALNPVFQPSFIAHSFSCQKGKGTHRGVMALEAMLRRVSRNGTRPCFALKCDIRQFFASVDHSILLDIIGRRIADQKMLVLLREIIGSFHVSCPGKGIPIGNLTSQLFANVYLNEFDHFMKNTLRVKQFVRYTDDFAIVFADDGALKVLLPPIRSFLHETLRLELHPHKVTLRKYRQGIDFLGYVLLPHYRLVRTKTKRRIFRVMRQKAVAASSTGLLGQVRAEQSLQSYLGVLSHADCHSLGEDLRNQYWYWKHER